ncbi:MAG TPA: Nramp family divalent metal transporter, partial [Deinococcales bacterium]|nr:Nramp family divalent metal transporter [Deinococcales bacterium]
MSGARPVNVEEGVRVPLQEFSDDWVTRRAQDVLEHGLRHGVRGILPFLGPAFIAAVAYVDPGNFATNIQAGAQYGYLLLWVVLASNIMAMLIQTLSAKLGIATGQSLPELMRTHLRRPWAKYFYWIQAELMAVATDLAEFLGAALAFQLLAGIPLLWGAALTMLISFGLLALQRYGFRPLEAAITVLITV